jgi:hypothetical protein
VPKIPEEGKSAHCAHFQRFTVVPREPQRTLSVPRVRACADDLLRYGLGYGSHKSVTTERPELAFAGIVSVAADGRSVVFLGRSFGSRYGRALGAVHSFGIAAYCNSPWHDHKGQRLSSLFCNFFREGDILSQFTSISSSITPAVLYILLHKYLQFCVEDAENGDIICTTIHLIYTLSGKG